jgi:hypothetical protein
MVLKRKKETLEEIRGLSASRDFSTRNRKFYVCEPERLRRSTARAGLV